jgi:hypothetical protein
LLEVFIVQNDKDNRGFFNFVKLGEGPMSEFCAALGFSMDAGDLVKFVGYELSYYSP